MEFGVKFFPVVDPERKSASTCYDESLHLAEPAEALRSEHVQTVEHHGSPYGGYGPGPVVFLTAVAARTSRIRLVTGAVIASFAHPVQLAARPAQLDNLSHGRLDVGFGRGFLPDEFELFGVPMAQSRTGFDEVVDACVALWSGQAVPFEGEVHRFGPVTGFPRPHQRPHPPVFVASATSPESCAARPLMAPGPSGAVASWGRARSDQYPGYEAFVEKVRGCDFDPALADHKVPGGTPGEVAAQIDTIRGWYGDDLCLSLQFNSGHVPFERSGRAMELFADEVAPAVTGDLALAA